jgi:hypothetical protein
MKLTIADSIKREVAEKAVIMSAPGYSTDWQGGYYAVDADGDKILDAVYHRQANASWDPWHDSAIAVDISSCIDGGIQASDEEIEEEFFDDAVDFMVGELKGVVVV